jgi:hypothetical protein
MDGSNISFDTSLLQWLARILGHGKASHQSLVENSYLLQWWIFYYVLSPKGILTFLVLCNFSCSWLTLCTVGCSWLSTTWIGRMTAPPRYYLYFQLTCALLLVLMLYWLIVHCFLIINCSTSQLVLRFQLPTFHEMDLWLSILTYMETVLCFCLAY